MLYVWDSFQQHVHVKLWRALNALSNAILLLPLNIFCSEYYILFQTRQCRQASNLKILVNNWEISNVKSTDFLGVVIDSNLSWETHIERTCSRIRCNLFIINRLSKILDLNERKTLYYGLIYPFLSYGIAV
jgi:hypothetical protein